MMGRASTTKGAKREGKGKQNSTADMRNVDKNCMDIGVIPRLQVLVDGQLCCADEELIIHRLYLKMIDQPFPNQTIHEVDFFLYHPQQLSQMHLPSQVKEWYFLTPSDKYGQSNSANNEGYWEPCGTDSLIHKDGNLIGYRKTLIYIEEKHEKNRSRAEWLVHEYRLDRSRDVRTGKTSDDMQWVVCKLYKLIAAEEKEATKSTGPNDGVSRKGLTIQGPKKESNIINDEGPSNVLRNDLHPVLDTNPVTATLHSSSILLDQIWSFDKPHTYPWRQHDQGTVLPTPKTEHVERNTLTPASDQGCMIPNAESQPQRDQGTMLLPPLPQNDQRTMLPTSTGPREANSDVFTDKVPSNSLNHDLHPLAASSQGSVIPGGSEKFLRRPTGIFSFDGEWPLYPAFTELSPFDVPFGSLTEDELAFFNMPDPGYPQACENKKEVNK
ncbi:hypothetical protein K7X08_022225 [Anisodus acutangulus]|uniref:NAC domain-containing protein n=1 Tax=Anisodus acutangulus TaxID=402998 RepID=A0A9Q1L4R6_9SOLA|nr:hypothetical protein K7X08_022225 [Anisodus acutangulus]